MKLRLDLKLAVDHYLGAPIAWVLNIISQLVGPFFGRDHSFVNPPKTVLFLKFIGLGSIVRASFLLPAVKQRFPNAKIAFAVFPGCSSLVKMYSEVDEVIVVRDNSAKYLVLDTFKLIFWCWKNNVDLVIDLEVHAKYSSIISALSLATNRAGFAGVTSRFRRGLYTHLVFWNPVRFVERAYEQLGESIGLVRKNHAIINISDEAKKEVQNYLTSLNIDVIKTKLIAINANASDLRSERRWPRNHVVSLIESLPKNINATVLLVGAPAEHSYVQTILDEIKNASHPVFNVAGKVSFSGFVYLLSILDGFVTNDSGPFHLSRQFDTPTVSVWGPTHPANYSPRGKNHISLFKPIYCSPCTHASDVPPCAGDNQCLKQLHPYRVLRALCQLMKIPPPQKPLDYEEQLSELTKINGKRRVLGYWTRDSAPLE